MMECVCMAAKVGVEERVCYLWPSCSLVISLCLILVWNLAKLECRMSAAVVPGM